jgi:hypothetical protein
MIFTQSKYVICLKFFWKNSTNVFLDLLSIVGNKKYLTMKINCNYSADNFLTNSKITLNKTAFYQRNELI